MPTKPKVQNFDASNTAAVLNAVRNDIGGDYAAKVPQAFAAGDQMPNGRVATKEDALQQLQDIGRIINNYRPFQNAFLDQIVNRIGLVIIRNRLYSNPWAAFKQGMLELGETIEEIFVGLCEAHQYDPETAETQWMKREIPSVYAVFHIVNFKKFYKQTTQRDDLRAAFTSWGGLEDLISKIITAMYTSANYDEFLMLKYMVACSIINGQMYPVTIPAPSLTTADSIMVQMKNVSELATYMSTIYNFYGVPTYTDKSDQYFIMSSLFSANIDVGSLARAFNLDKVELMGRIVGVNNFTFTTEELKRLGTLIGDDPNYQVFTTAQKTLLANVGAVMIDRNFFQVYDVLEEMDEQPNMEGRYWQHWLHVWKVFSTSPFATAIVFAQGESTVTGVTLSPTSVTVMPGQSVAFTAAVATTGYASQSYDLTSTLYDIGANGILHVPADAPNGTVTVTATSRFDPTKTGTATVTISDGTTPDDGDDDTKQASSEETPST